MIFLCLKKKIKTMMNHHQAAKPLASWTAFFGIFPPSMSQKRLVFPQVCRGKGPFFPKYVVHQRVSIPQVCRTRMPVFPRVCRAANDEIPQVCRSKRPFSPRCVVRETAKSPKYVAQSRGADAHVGDPRFPSVGTVKIFRQLVQSPEYVVSRENAIPRVCRAASTRLTVGKRGDQKRR